MAATVAILEAVPGPVPMESPARRFYALSFGSTVAQLWLQPRELSPRAPAAMPARDFPKAFNESDLVCGMLGARAELLARLWQEGTVGKLVNDGLLAPAEKVCAAGYPFALRLLRTPAITYGQEWCGQMWKDAMLAVIDLMSALAKQDLTLRYPNPWNVLFDGPRPVYINPGSIDGLDEAAYRGAVDRLARGFLHPLHFFSKGQSRLARAPLRNLYGIPTEDFPELHELEQRRQQDLENSTPEEFLSRLRSDVDEMEISDAPTDWSKYGEAGAHGDPPLKPGHHWGDKQWEVRRVLEELRPRTVRDLASISGWFARLTALAGAEVIATDLNETCVSRLNQQARQESGHVLPLVLDLIDPSPCIGMVNGWLPSAKQRLHADLVLALAISHRLVLAGLRLTFDQVAAGFAGFARRWLLIELVPFESEHNSYTRYSRPDCVSWYDLEHFTRALGEYFGIVSVLPSPAKSRKLVLCERSWAA